MVECSTLGFTRCPCSTTRRKVISSTLGPSTGRCSSEIRSPSSTLSLLQTISDARVTASDRYNRLSTRLSRVLRASPQRRRMVAVMTANIRGSKIVTTANTRGSQSKISSPARALSRESESMQQRQARRPNPCRCGYTLPTAVHLWVPCSTHSTTARSSSISASSGHARLPPRRLRPPLPLPSAAFCPFPPAALASSSRVPTSIGSSQPP
mmetsp:Transcript_16573/g.32420  ORF Transcript_16573/g.32420 Transcript_16573/m.32420 type:complete len:210 (+) Transcript_16573:1716-2345(+)